MFPWIWLWSPELHFPWSGEVRQRIAPQTDWFFGAIKPEAGDGELERRMFERASYGDQLGLVMEALAGLDKASPAKDERARAALDELAGLRGDLKKMKAERAETRERGLRKRLESLREEDPEAFARLKAVFSEG